MQVVYLGPAPDEFLQDGWSRAPQLMHGQPLFEVDALFVFAGQNFEAEDRYRYELLAGSGRPIVKVGAVMLRGSNSHQSGNLLMVADYMSGEASAYETWIADRPRTNYEPVASEIHDLLEGFVEKGKPVPLTVMPASGPQLTTEIELLSTKRHREEEFVQLADKCWIRLDRILQIDGRQLTRAKRD